MIEDEGRIHNMRFSYNGNLYIMVLTETEQIYYRLNVEADFKPQEDTYAKAFGKQSTLNPSNTVVASAFNKIDEEFEISNLEEICRIPIGMVKPRKFYVVEELIGFDMQVTFLTIEEDEMRITRCTADGDKIETFFDKKIGTIKSLNHNTFIIKPPEQE